MKAKKKLIITNKKDVWLNKHKYHVDMLKKQATVTNNRRPLWQKVV